eukprot:m51a1_g8498 putative u5 small nuclear ribonucleoprotein 200 kda helicase-like (2194) ;mRNA; r:37531-45528
MSAEAFARSKQHTYHALANLVLNQERKPRQQNEGTGEPETLRGKISISQFGDRAQFTRPPELEERIKKLREKRARGEAEGAEGEELRVKRKRRGREGAAAPADVLQATEEQATYRPRTRETRAAYEALLALVQDEVGDQPQDVLRGAAEEVLEILKDDAKKAPEKQAEAARALSAEGLTNEKFAELTQVVARITDYRDPRKSAAAAAPDDAAGAAHDVDDEIDEETGVAVIIDDDGGAALAGMAGGEGGDGDVLVDDDQPEGDGDGDDDDEGEDTKTGAQLLARPDDDAAAAADAAGDAGGLDAREIDAYWLQRRVREFEPDAVAAQALSEKVMAAIAGAEGDDRAAENELVVLLGRAQFGLIKQLLRDRRKVVWCTRLAKAGGDEEREAIKREMAASPEGQRVLAQLAGAPKDERERSKNRDFEASLRREARTARDAAAEDAARQRRTLDLEAMAFEAGGHFMSNAQCKLPPGSFREQKTGYEEIHIPKQRPAAADDVELVPVASMPKWAQQLFPPRVQRLNYIQSRVYAAAIDRPDNLLVCAPTGSGKTVVAMLCMLREIGLCVDAATGRVDRAAFKIVYVAPMKSLVQEMVGNFSQRFKPLDLVVRELSGDASLTKRQLAETQVIVTTPEKWDIVTRKSGGDRALLEAVRLVVIDEVHLLHDSRGPVIEALVARTLRTVEQTREHVRVVGLSATLPNYDDVAAFLRVRPENVFHFDNAHRPVPLEQTYIGVSERKAVRRLELMNEIVYDKVAERAGQCQMLVFVHSRKETAKTARFLRDAAVARDAIARFLKPGSGSREVLQAEAAGAGSADLQELLPYGFAVHHAGLAREDRSLVEDLFADGHVQVLVSTSTLAWGVNLPAHTVIIKGTQVYSPERGRWAELSPLDVMQMVGRAGRPQYDTEGEGILITSHAELQYYLSLLNHQLPIESQFVSTLPDTLNAEVVLGNVASVRDAVQWLGYTYLYVCMLRDPRLYGADPAAVAEGGEDPYAERHRADLVHSAAAVLDRAGLVKYDRRTGALAPTDLGRVASHYYVTHRSMATYNEHLKPTMGDIELLRLFSLSSEFRLIPVRQEERAELERLVDRVPVPVKEGVDEPSAKINVLLQAYISRQRLQGFALVSDMVYVTQSAGRIVRALFEIVLRRGWAQLAERTLQLGKMVERRMWACSTPLRQFRTFPEDVARRIERQDVPFARLYDLSAQELGELAKAPERGKSVFRHVHAFPRVDLAVAVQPLTRAVLTVELTVTPDFAYDERLHGGAVGWWVLVEDVDGEQLLHAEYAVLKAKHAGADLVLSFTVPVAEPLPPQYFVRVVADRWLGAETSMPVSFRHLILPAKFAPPTELLDLQPLPLEALRVRQFAELLAARGYAALNPVQTQAFSALYESDDSVLVCAPAASGKTLCAELAVLRAVATRPEGSARAGVVWVSPSPLRAQRRRRELAELLGPLGLAVGALSGDAAADARAAEALDVVVATGEQWDQLSTRWRQRRAVQAARLLVVDALHLVGAPGGHATEALLSRARYMAVQGGARARVVALSAPLANARDVAGWLGVKPAAVFNFHPNVRPAPLEVHVQGFDQAQPGARAAAMARPVLQAVKRHAQGRPAIVFCASRKQAHAIARELVLFADPADPERCWLRIPREDMERETRGVRSRLARDLLCAGIALAVEGMDEAELDVVQQVFDAGAARVMVATREQAWAMPCAAHTVVVMGTEYYDGRARRYADYAVADVLEMMGRASRAAPGAAAKCVILCHAAKKELYKRFLYEPLPVESHMQHFLHDHLVAEVVARTVENKQDAVDWLTWTLMYYRLAQNPNYYNMTGATHQHVNDMLSELVESTLEDLERAKCVAVDGMDVTALNLGHIAAYYGVRYTTVELLAASLAERTKLRALVGVVASASEYADAVPVRHRDDEALRKLAAHLPVAVKPAEGGSFKDPNAKANVLLQAHMCRRALPSEMAADQAAVVALAPRLLSAAVDVVSSCRWLAPALAAMELSQLVVQALWESDAALRQLPHFDDAALLADAAARGVEGVLDLVDLDDAARAELLGRHLSAEQVRDVAAACNRYPNVDVAYEVSATRAAAGDKVAVSVRLERVGADEGAAVPSVHAPYMPRERAEGWWLVVGEEGSNALESIKRVALGKSAKARLEWAAPAAAGPHEYTLYLMSDSYIGCDQEYRFTLDVAEPMDTSA